MTNEGIALQNGFFVDCEFRNIGHLLMHRHPDLSHCFQLLFDPTFVIQLKSEDAVVPQKFADLQWRSAVRHLQGKLKCKALTKICLSAHHKRYPFPERWKNASQSSNNFPGTRASIFSVCLNLRSHPRKDYFTQGSKLTLIPRLLEQLFNEHLMFRFFT